MSYPGHSAKSENLRAYAQKLANGAEKTAEIKNLVDQADVSDEAWGVVGLKVKQEYTTLLNNLNELLDNMSDGYNSGNENFMNAASAYDEQENEVAQLLHQLTDDADVDIAQI